MPAAQAKISELLLDGDNPRIVSTEGQRDVLRELINDQGDKIAVLVQSIRDEGLNPSERMLVMVAQEKPRRYTVLEGNRRVAALKILSNPQQLVSLEISPQLRKKLEVLADGFDRKSVEPVEVYVVKDRKAAAAWISLKHTGENRGKGVVSWSGVAAARFRGAVPALQVLDFVKRHADLKAEERELVDDNNFPITTLQRLLDARDVRKRLGFDVVNQRVAVTVDPAEAVRALRKIVLDLAQRKISVSDIKNKTQQKAYVDGFAKSELPDLSKSLPQPQDLEGVQSLGAASGVSSAGAQPGRPNKPKRTNKPARKEIRRTLVPKNCPIEIDKNNKISAVLHELQTLQLSETPHAIAVLLRVFLELSVDHFLTQNGVALRAKDQKSGKTFDKTLKTKVEEVVAHLVSSGTSTKKDFLSVTQGIANANSPLYIDLLHGYVHNKFVVPVPSDLIASWDIVQPLFERIWK